MPSYKLILPKKGDDNGHAVSRKDQEERPFYWFINHGDFDIVWTNVSVFIIGHVLYIYAYYLLFTDFPWQTWFWSEYIDCKHLCSID